MSHFLFADEIYDSSAYYVFRKTRHENRTLISCNITEKNTVLLAPERERERERSGRGVGGEREREGRVRELVLKADMKEGVLSNSNVFQP